VQAHQKAPEPPSLKEIEIEISQASPPAAGPMTSAFVRKAYHERLAALNTAETLGIDTFPVGEGRVGEDGGQLRLQNFVSQISR